MKRLSLILLALVLAVAGCALPGTNPTDMPAETEEPDPPASEPSSDDGGGGEESDLAEAEPLPPVELSEELALQQAAMREGFENDVITYGRIPYYRFRLDVQTDPVHVTGRADVTYTNLTGGALDEIVFRLYPNAFERLPPLEVGDVDVAGEVVRARMQVQDTVLTVPLSEELSPNEAVTVGIDFTFSVPTESFIAWGRISDVEGIAVLSSFLPLLSVVEDGEWWTEFPAGPGDPAYSEVAFFDVTVAISSFQKVAASGTMIEHNPGGATDTYRYVTGPMRDFSLAFSEDFELDTDTADGITVNVWSLPGEDATDDAVLNDSVESLVLFNEIFGEYPYGEIDVVQSNMLASGIEYPGVFYISSKLWNPDAVALRHVVVHEMAHEWWYGLVGNDQVGEPWIDEGLAEFSYDLYERTIALPPGWPDARLYYQTELDDYLDDVGETESIGRAAVTYEGRQYRVFVYSAGALFYNELEDMFGVDAVAEYLADYYEQHRYGIATNESVRALIDEHFGAEGTALFDAWILGE